MPKRNETFVLIADVIDLGILPTKKVRFYFEQLQTKNVPGFGYHEVVDRNKDVLTINESYVAH